MIKTKRIYHTALFIGIFISVLTGYSNNSLEQFKKQFQNQEYQKCIKNTSQYLDSIRQHNAPLKTQVDYIYLLGRAHLHENKKENYEALKYLLQSLKIYSNLQKYERIQENTYLLGLLYERWEAYPKAINYYKASLNFSSDKNTRLLHRIAHCQYEAKQYNQATNSYLELLEIYRKQKNSEEKLYEVYDLLFLVANQTYSLKEMLLYKKGSLLISQKLQDTLKIIQAHNNIGYIYQELKKTEKSIKHFNYALKYISYSPQKYREKQLTVLTNKAYAFSSQQEYKKALNIYKSNLEEYMKLKDSVGIAKTYNFIGSIYYLRKNINRSAEHFRKGIYISELTNEKETLAEGYKALSDIYQYANNFKKSQYYYTKYLDIIAAKNEKKYISKQENLQQQLQIEKKENKYQQLIAEQEKERLAYEKLLLKNEKSQSEKSLEIAHLKAQHLENQQKTQMLLLTQEKLNSSKIQEELKLIEKEKQIQRLQLTQKEFEEKLKEETIQSLKNDQVLKEKVILEGERTERYGIALIGLSLLITTIIGIGYIRNRILQKQLKENNERLEYKSIELDNKNQALINSQDSIQQKVKELEAQKNFIKHQKEILEKTNNRLKTKDKLFQDNLDYSQGIQQFLLPPIETFNHFFANSFIIFQPRSIVSGDFYWATQLDNKFIVIIADCTAHGIPGAFTSMLSSTLLSNITHQEKLTEPSKIIQRLYQGLMETMSEESCANNSMNLGACIIEKQDSTTYQVQFAGTNSNMHIMIDNRLKTIEGDSFALSHEEEKELSLSTQSCTLQKENTIYFSTTGLEKVLDKDTKSILSSINTVSFDKQKEKVSEIISTETIDKQKDDITLLGFKL